MRSYAGGVLKFLLIVALFAVVTYVLIRLMQQRGAGPSPARRRPGRPGPQPPRVLGPDDDEDFLRDLERKRRKKKLKPEDPES